MTAENSASAGAAASFGGMGLRLGLRLIGSVLLVGLAGASAAWPAWWLVALLLPWPRSRGSRLWAVRGGWLLAGVLMGAFWGAWLPADFAAPLWSRPALLTALLLAAWSGGGLERADDRMARWALSGVLVPPLVGLGWALAQQTWPQAGQAAGAVLVVVLWHLAGRQYAAFARAQGPAWQVAALFFTATLVSGGALFWLGSGGASVGGEAAPLPTPHPALAATLTAVAVPAESPQPPMATSTATATASPTSSPTPTLATPTATPSPLPPTPTPSPTPFPTFPPPPVYTGYGVVQVPASWGQGARVRSAPNEQARVVAVVANGTLLQVLGYKTQGITVWLRVRPLDARWEGWIISTALQVATPAPR